jgi:hypothetical protein
MIPDDETALCPLDGCTQPHAARLRALLDTPLSKIPIRMDAIRRGGIDGALSRAVVEASAARNRAVEEVLRKHYAEDHDVLDYLRTIHRLQCELAGYESGIRPHMAHMDRAATVAPAEGCTPPPDLAEMLAAGPSPAVVDQLRAHLRRDDGGRG